MFRLLHNLMWMPFTGDCPDFRGASDVAMPKCLTAAKMGLSPCPDFILSLNCGKGQEVA